MKTEYPNKESARKEATPVFRSFWPSSQPVSEFLTNAVKVATVLAAFWGIGFSVISGLENRLIDRIDLSNRELSAQIDGLQRSMTEGFKQAHQRMDRIEGRMDERMDRIEADVDQIESDIDQIEADIDQIEADVDQIEADVDAIEKHLLRIGSAIDSEGAPATNVPAVAAPARHLGIAGDVGSFDPPANPESGEIRSPNSESTAEARSLTGPRQ